MGRTLLLCAALLAAAGVDSRADAFAEVKLTRITGGIDSMVLFDFDPLYTLSSYASGLDHDSVYTSQSDTSLTFTSRPLTLGETFYVDVAYTITLRDSGGMSPAPGFHLSPGSPEGFLSSVAGAFAAVAPGIHDPRSNPFGIARTVQWVAHRTEYDTAASQLTFSGMARGTYRVVEEPADDPQGRITVAVITFAQSSLVPEPGTWATLLAGLAVLAGAARRGRQARMPSSRA